MVYTDYAYAKINLYLSIDSKRADGYHNITSIMQTISLSDRIAIDTEGTEEGIVIKTNNDQIPTGESNLITKTARLFYAQTNIPMPNLTVAIDKKIPIGAGLAGGSADAACVLRILNKHHNYPIPETKIGKLASDLGADVPFCLHGGTSLCEEIGDKITHISSLPPCQILVCIGNETKSTKSAYEAYDKQNKKSKKEPREPIMKLQAAFNAQNLDFISSKLFNAFEDTQLTQFPEAQNIRRILQDFKAKGVLMTGSGPAIFGIFEKDANLNVLSSILGALGYHPFICQPISPNYQQI